MNLHLRLVLLIAIIIYFSLLYHFLKKGKLILKYTLLWIFLGIVMAVVVVFPSIIIYFTKLCGIADSMNGLFAIVCFGMLILLMSLTSISSKLNEKNKNLIQKVGILEYEIRKLKQELHKEKENDNVDIKRI